MNTLSYASHYRSLDSTVCYARQALAVSRRHHISYAQAEALNNLAFASIIRMHYDLAQQQLDSIPLLTDNQLELLVSYVQQMRLCQRRSRNREFHEYRELADRSLRRISEERQSLSPRQARRLVYAETEYAIVNSTYYYYVGLERQSQMALEDIHPEGDIRQDTAQYLNYLYNVGAGGILTDGDAASVEHQEFGLLLHCFQLATKGHYPFFAAQAQEAMAEHLMLPEERGRLADEHVAGIRLVNPEGVPLDELPLWLADNALATFQEYGDVYQIAGAYRTLASCHHAMGDDESALFNLEQALNDTTILQAPDLVASIREQLSVAYAALGDKPQSDQSRNLYLDLQEQTRQDRSLEARAAQLEHTSQQLSLLLVAVVIAIVMLLFLLWLFSYLSHRQRTDNQQLAELLEQRQEQLALVHRQLEQAQRLHLEQRARLSLVNGITPLIDRMLHEIGRMEADTRHASPTAQSDNAERLDYIRELTDNIQQQNDVLTHWIQLQQGQLSLHIESFALEPLFDLVARSRHSFQMKGIALDVSPTDAVVKADRTLTLFMLNTLADNARKFTPEGGHVSIAAQEGENYVELSVSDTGVGMDAEQLAHVFERKPIVDTPAQSSSASHGFGLQNCKGIIEKYRKLSQLFSVCQLTAESRQGEGSRFAFRLPKSVLRLLAPLLMVVAPHCLWAQSSADTDPLSRAAIYADSAYFSNINGNYERTLQFTDSSRVYLNQYYLQQQPHGHLLMQREGSTAETAPEIQWLHDSLNTNYSIILDMRNESAVAALALHQWQLYAYNNRIYTQLYKELSADNTLADYCRTMQQSQANKTIAIILLVLVALLILPAYYVLYYRQRINSRIQSEQQQRQCIDEADDQLRRMEMETERLHVANAVLDNCLSSLKHETMYYPSRIRQLADAADVDALAEVARYYRELYALLGQQAMRQVERLHIDVRQQPDGLLVDAVLHRYLLDILRKVAGQRVLDVQQHDLDAKYVELTVTIPTLHLTDAEAQDLFTPLSPDHIPFLLCRQIVRDHGEATHRRRCSIRAEAPNRLHIVLPRCATRPSQHTQE